MADCLGHERDSLRGFLFEGHEANRQDAEDAKTGRRGRKLEIGKEFHRRGRGGRREGRIRTEIKQREDMELIIRRRGWPTDYTD